MAMTTRPVSDEDVTGHRGWLQFNFHGRVTMGVAGDSPTAPLLAEMFAPFLTEGLERFDVQVTPRGGELANASYAETDYRYTDTGLYLVASRVQIEVDPDGGFRVSGTRELLTTVLPLLDSLLARRGAAMIHAATFDVGGRGVAMPAWGGTGKTSTIAKLLRIPGVSFMGDDWAFVGDDGQLLGFAKPMFIKPHHRSIYPHLFEGKKKPLAPPSLSAPLARLTTLVHPVMTQYPRLAGLSRRWSPEYIMVHPRQAAPGATIATTSSLAAVVFVERWDGSEVVLRERDRPWMVSRLVGNFHAEITRHSQEVMTALGATSLLPLHETFARKAAILESALGDKPTLLLQVPQAMSADEASDRIVEHLGQVLDAHGMGWG